MEEKRAKEREVKGEKGENDAIPRRRSILSTSPWVCRRSLFGVPQGPLAVAPTNSQQIASYRPSSSDFWLDPSCTSEQILGAAAIV